MKAILAIDSFKGCVTSSAANEAAASGVRRRYPKAEIVKIPVSDGGEGWLDAFHAAIGGEIVSVDAVDPLMRPIKADYLKAGDLAAIEVAKACGLTLLAPDERNPLKATTYGVGLLVVDAVKSGCRRIVVGLGGSATSDAGRGMITAIEEHLNGGKSLVDCKALNGVKFSIASDVDNPLCGPRGAAHIFAPQKGATPEMVEILDRQAREFADATAEAYGFDHSERSGAGAAGGLGYAFMQFLDADCQLGIELLLDTIDFRSIVDGADVVFTGEGSADRQTLMGKLPYGVMRRALDAGVSTYLIAGHVADRQSLVDAGFADAVCINPPGLPLAEAMRPEVATANIADTVERVVMHNA